MVLRSHHQWLLLQELELLAIWVAYIVVDSIRHACVMGIADGELFRYSSSPQFSIPSPLNHTMVVYSPKVAINVNHWNVIKYLWPLGAWSSEAANLMMLILLWSSLSYYTLICFWQSSSGHQQHRIKSLSVHGDGVCHNLLQILCFQEMKQEVSLGAFNDQRDTLMCGCLN